MSAPPSPTFCAKWKPKATPPCCGSPPGWTASAKKTAAELFVPPAALRAACKKIPKPLLKALRDAAGRIGDYHRRQIPKSWRRKDAFGNIVGERMTAMARAAVYAPGGRAAYPSSALMGLIPAKIAGVGEVFLFSPPAKGGLPPLILAAAAVGGADGVWTIGGAQALAAAAFGTETIPRADVAVGPGNAYVAEAKRQLAGRVGVDSLAGPSELLIVGDRATNAEWAAADMLAQAEHDEHAQSIALSPSAEFLDKLEKALAKQLAGQPREKIIRRSLSERGALIWAKDMDACCQIADEIAAEHLQVMCANAAKVAGKIRNAGGIFYRRVFIGGAGRLRRGSESCVAHGGDGAVCLAAVGGSFYEAQRNLAGIAVRRKSAGKNRRRPRRCRRPPRPRPRRPAEREIKKHFPSPFAQRAASFALPA